MDAGGGGIKEWTISTKTAGRQHKEHFAFTVRTYADSFKMF